MKCICMQYSKPMTPFAKQGHVFPAPKPNTPDKECFVIILKIHLH